MESKDLLQYAQKTCRTKKKKKLPSSLDTYLQDVSFQVVHATYLISKFLIHEWFAHVHERLCDGVCVHHVVCYYDARECVL